MVNWLEFVKMNATPVSLRLVFSQALGDVPAVQNLKSAGLRLVLVRVALPRHLLFLRTVSWFVWDLNGYRLIPGLGRFLIAGLCDCLLT